MVMEGMSDVSMRFWFNKKNDKSLLFASQHEIIEYEYTTHVKSTLFTLENLNLDE